MTSNLIRKLTNHRRDLDWQHLLAVKVPVQKGAFSLLASLALGRFTEPGHMEPGLRPLGTNNSGTECPRLRPLFFAVEVIPGLLDTFKSGAIGPGNRQQLRVPLELPDLPPEHGFIDQFFEGPRADIVAGVDLLSFAGDPQCG